MPRGYSWFPLQKIIIMFKRVMLIDEDVTSNLIFTKLSKSIKLSGEIQTFISAIDALEHFKEYRQSPDKLPTCIFLDIKMPIMNGWEFLEAFNRTFPELVGSIPVFILSSSDADNDLKMAGNFPQVVKYIVKPLGLKTLLDLKNNQNLLQE